MPITVSAFTIYALNSTTFFNWLCLNKPNNGDHCVSESFSAWKAAFNVALVLILMLLAALLLLMYCRGRLPVICQTITNSEPTTESPQYDNAVHNELQPYPTSAHYDPIQLNQEQATSPTTYETVDIRHPKLMEPSPRYSSLQINEPAVSQPAGVPSTTYQPLTFVDRSNTSLGAVHAYQRT